MSLIMGRKKEQNISGIWSHCVIYALWFFFELSQRGAKAQLSSVLLHSVGGTGTFSNTLQMLCKLQSNCRALQTPTCWMVFCTDYLFKIGRENQTTYTMCISVYKKFTPLSPIPSNTVTTCLLGSSCHFFLKELCKGKKQHSTDKGTQAQEHEVTFSKSESKSGLAVALSGPPAGLRNRLHLTRQEGTMPDH